jgi:hypothetical protein
MKTIGSSTTGISNHDNRGVPQEPVDDQQHHQADQRMEQGRPEHAQRHQFEQKHTRFT